jgi:hypothetical protein
MSVGFGFSVGDVITALEVVGTVIDALRRSGEASTQYRELNHQLWGLETALSQAKRLELDRSQHAEYAALCQVVSQCQETIDDFLKKIEKYQPHLRSGGSSSRAKDIWMKIRWTRCKTEDLARFKADLLGHTVAIELLLTTLHM